MITWFRNLLAVVPFLIYEYRWYIAWFPLVVVTMFLRNFVYPEGGIAYTAEILYALSVYVTIHAGLKIARGWGK